MARHGISFGIWDIPHEERTRISYTSVGIVAFRAPAFCISMSQVFLEGVPSDIIMLDRTFLETELITGPEQIGIILHEIGHIVNKPESEPAEYMERNSSSLEEELYADYYTHHCGYGQHFARAMTKMREAKIYGFDMPNIQLRLDALAAPTKRRLNRVNFPSSDP